MFGRLIQALDDPDVARRVLAALGDGELSQRLAEAAAASGRSPDEMLAATVRGFLETARDDQFVQLIGILNRAQDPGPAAMRAILDMALPQTGSIASGPLP